MRFTCICKNVIMIVPNIVRKPLFYKTVVFYIFMKNAAAYTVAFFIVKGGRIFLGVRLCFIKRRQNVEKIFGKWQEKI